MKSLLDSLERAEQVAESDDPANRISISMRQLVAELVAIESMANNLMGALATEDPNREDMIEIHRAACLALAKLERLGHRAPRLGVV